MTLQPFLQDVVDVRFAELPVTSQFAMQGWMILIPFVSMFMPRTSSILPLESAYLMSSTQSRNSLSH